MQQKLWTKDFLLFFGSNFFIGLNFYLLMTTMTLYAMQQFSASESLAGLASSIFVIGALIARLLVGGTVEKFGRKKLLYSGLLLFIVAVFMYFFTSSIILLFIVRFMQRCCIRYCKHRYEYNRYGFTPDRSSRRRNRLLFP